MDADEAKELRTALARACGLSPTGSVADGASPMAELARRVDYLLRHDVEKLTYYLYSLDVAEDVLVRALAEGATEPPARFIAKAIIDREAARIRTRKQYEQQRERDDFLTPRGHTELDE